MNFPNRKNYRMDDRTVAIIAAAAAEWGESENAALRRIVKEWKQKENLMININRSASKVVVSGYGKQYSVDENAEARLANGNESGMTYGEAFEAGLLRVVDDPDGETSGMHGALYVA